MSLRDEKLKDADLSLGDVQKSQKPWVKHNFGNRPSWMPLIGVMEELGELAHAFLKKAQGIRGTAKEHDLAIKDAVADIVIFLCDFCSSQGIDLEREVIETWAKVKTRDWKKDKKMGVTATKHKNGAKRKNKYKGQWPFTDEQRKAGVEP
jgi:NTP pyrophosphatase (non-canonical NTP hydrolase)